jgi:hypothetical protein
MKIRLSSTVTRIFFLCILAPLIAMEKLPINQTDAKLPIIIVYNAYWSPLCNKAITQLLKEASLHDYNTFCLSLDENLSDVELLKAYNQSRITKCDQLCTSYNIDQAETLPGQSTLDKNSPEKILEHLLQGKTTLLLLLLCRKEPKLVGDILNTVSLIRQKPAFEEIQNTLSVAQENKWSACGVMPYSYIHEYRTTEITNDQTNIVNQATISKILELHTNEKNIIFSVPIVNAKYLIPMIRTYSNLPPICHYVIYSQNCTNSPSENLEETISHLKKIPEITNNITDLENEQNCIKWAKNLVLTVTNTTKKRKRSEII